VPAQVVVVKREPRQYPVPRGARREAARPASAATEHGESFAVEGAQAYAGTLHPGSGLGERKEERLVEQAGKQAAEAALISAIFAGSG